MTKVFLGLGSNLGNRGKNILEAITYLSGILTVVRMSSLYETEPEEYKDQPDFINCVLQAEYSDRPRLLLSEIKQIERKMGRTTSFRAAPRVIDIDILLFGDSVIEEADLYVPHPRIDGRKFVLIPMAEIDPDFKHPVTHKSIADLVSELDSQSRVMKVGTIGPK